MAETALTPTANPREGLWGCTMSGRRFYPLDPRVEDIDIQDIAHALGMLPRFGGHALEFYSVAEHSVHSSVLVESWGESPMQQLCALLHDASEAYLLDIPRPIKLSPVMDEYRVLEERWSTVIASRFGLPEFSPAVWKADEVLLATEARELMRTGCEASPEHWELSENHDESVARRLIFWDPRYASIAFMNRFHTVIRALHD